MCGACVRVRGAPEGGSFVRGAQVGGCLGLTSLPHTWVASPHHRLQDSARRTWRKLDSEYQLQDKAARAARRIEEQARDVSAPRACWEERTLAMALTHALNGGAGCVNVRAGGPGEPSRPGTGVGAPEHPDAEVAASRNSKSSSRGSSSNAARSSWPRCLDAACRGLGPFSSLRGCPGVAAPFDALCCAIPAADVQRAAQGAQQRGARAAHVARVARAARRLLRHARRCVHPAYSLALFASVQSQAALRHAPTSPRPVRRAVPPARAGRVTMLVVIFGLISTPFFWSVLNFALLFM